MDGFEQLGQFTGDDQGALAENAGHIGHRFEHAMRRLVKTRAAGCSQRLPAPAALARQAGRKP